MRRKFRKNWPAVLLATLFSISAAAEDLSPLDRLKMALDSGNVSISIQKAWLSKDRDTAFQTIYDAATKGDPSAANLMGVIYDSGRWGMQKRPEMALRWFEKAAPKNGYAAYNMGVMWVTGRAGSINAEKAAKYFEDGWGKSPVPQAAVRLAHFYYGRGDLKNAWKWAVIAKNNTPKYGAYIAGRILMEGGPVHRDFYLATQEFQRAEEAYSAPAARALSLIYGSGEPGVEKNAVQAYAQDVIANGIEGQQAPSNWEGGLSDDDRHRGKSFGENWLLTHQRPASVDYTNTLSGLD